MTRFVVGDDRGQSTLFPERLDDYLGDDNPVRAVDVFVDELDLARLGFGGVAPEATGRPAYHPATLLKIYVYGYLNRVQSSRRLERECQRNIELVWLTGRLMPDFKTIADFRKDNGEAIRKVCREFVVLCRRLELFSEASVAIDGSKFKAVNTRDRNFTQAKMQRRLAQIDESIARYSFASILVSAGASLPLIGQLLGHTQAQTTHRYAHLFDRPMRDAAETVGVFVDVPRIVPSKTPAIRDDRRRRRS
jgi:transposase